MSLTYRTLRGAEVSGVLDTVARLRIEVFRDWPYLYDGDLAYERAYLAGFGESAGSVVVVAEDGGRIVGAATGAPMEDHAGEFGAALPGRDLSRIFYCAESVLLPDWRGQGAGHAFFDRREDAARAMGRAWSVFCSVIRPADHPLRPEGARNLAPFWRGRGYRPVEGAVARFAWKDLDMDEETEKRLQVWEKRL